MRKILVMLGIIFITTSLIALAYTDTQLRILLFGLPQTPTSSPSGRAGPPSIPSTSPIFSATLQPIGYLRVISYLVGIGGLALIIIGLSLPTKLKKEVEIQAPSQPPPWEIFENSKEKEGETNR
ncbi:MAG: hypothetical protein RMJ31_05065 [Nitrososphaerota archaeon]|nr:hypothetical protein [Nitrososphaerales archaeon]MCX8191763.1 hypothetical protein [Nitrososphaerales archaeon]MDW8045126.1 hypothetical protein [Nitrososphaerota archaeon]